MAAFARVVKYAAVRSSWDHVVLGWQQEQRSQFLGDIQAAAIQLEAVGTQEVVTPWAYLGQH